jgi:hypothetical protein
LLIKVLPGLTFTGHPENRYAYEGEEAVFQVGVNGPAAITYQWWFARDEEKVAINPGGNTPVLALEAVASTQAGEYWCEISDGSNSLESVRASLFVAAPIAFTHQPADVAVPEKKSHTFHVATEGGFSPLQYFWFKDGLPLPDAEGPALILAGLQQDDAGSYHVEVLDSYTGAIVSGTADLSITAALPLLGGTALAFLAGLAGIAGALMVHGQARKR